MQSTTETVIARYLTTAGSGISDAELTVDIIDEVHARGRLRLVCRGCTWAHELATDSYVDDTEEETAERVARILPVARESAQSHAETCRALPVGGA
ncbi:hypothetical protein RMN57_13160 [Kitasatospora sp. CM 4170]|uniref:Uncharacterized protein n=1 Tax=Kitasatospora aburaviensis TaxID=67265 RepID=A0ABW1F5B3_9ACTN|nr:hypothetical protein [Kitasatospora sp. CM 4170]WNM45603.1 hypothetical protein RMN57_13160 [Kitasatospora sp. CM 4170]